MILCFYDVETTGKANFKLPPTHKEQPRVVSLSALLCDEKGNNLSSLNVIIKPRQFDIPKEAADIHGITNEMASALGVHIAFTVGVFADMARAAELHVGHNIDFDRFMMDGECERMSTEFVKKPQFCTMKEMTDICQLPGKYGWKWPKLEEAYQHCFGEPMKGAHNSMTDVLATKRIYFWLMNQRKAEHEAERDKGPETTRAPA